MTELTYTLPEIGEPSVAADPRTLAALQDILTWAGGNIDSTNLKAGGIEGASIKSEAVTEAKLSSAVVALLNTHTSGLTVKARASGSYTATNGELGVLFPTTGTATMPALAANAIVGVANTTSEIAALKVASSGEFIGNGRVLGSTMALAGHSSVTVQSDGANWFVISGGLDFTRGSGTASWIGGSNESGNTVISHGLGIAPSAVMITNTDTNSINQPVIYVVLAKEATTFTVKGFGSGTTGLTGTFDWVAFL